LNKGAPKQQAREMWARWTGMSHRIRLTHDTAGRRRARKRTDPPRPGLRITGINQKTRRIRRNINRTIKGACQKRPAMCSLSRGCEHPLCRNPEQTEPLVCREWSRRRLRNAEVVRRSRVEVLIDWWTAGAWRHRACTERAPVSWHVG
jgi:hypothetical protein